MRSALTRISTHVPGLRIACGARNQPTVVKTSIFARACSGGAAVLTADEGMEVAVHYKGTLEDGTTFDTSEGRNPLIFTCGAGMMIPGFDKGVRGMKVLP